MYTGYFIFFNFTLAFVLITEIIVVVLNFSVNFGQSTQKWLTESGTIKEKNKELQMY